MDKWNVPARIASRIVTHHEIPLHDSDDVSQRRHLRMQEAALMLGEKNREFAEHPADDAGDSAFGSPFLLG